MSSVELRRQALPCCHLQCLGVNYAKKRRLIDILLTAIGLSPGGRSTVHIYTQTIRRIIQNKQYIEQHNNFGRARAVPRLG
jgi:hypothetical protein